MGNGPVYREPNKKTKLVETGLTIKQFGKVLNSDYDITLLGEFHDSQKAQDMQKKIFVSTDSKALLIENSPSLQRTVNYTEGKADPLWGGKFVTENYAFKKGKPIIATDLEHHNSAISTNLASTAMLYKQGATEQMQVALMLAVGYLQERKIDTTKYKPGPADDTVVIKTFLKEHGHSLPRFHRNNLLEAAEDVDREHKTGLIPAIDRIGDIGGDVATLMINTLRRTKESDPVFVENIDRALIELRKKDPKANVTQTVGMAHNTGIERGLEKKGYNVANVKILITDKPEQDGRIFKVAKPSAKERAEWVVAVYDPSNISKGQFNKSFEVSNAGKSVHPSDLKPSGPALHR